MFLKPPLDSVPHLMRPCAGRVFSLGSKLLKVPSSTVPSSIGASDVAVGDGHVFGGAGVAQGEGTLGADAVVPRRVDGAVRDADVAAAVDVHAVAVGIDLQVVDGEVVDAGGEDAEVAAFEDREVAKDDVAAVFQRDGLVADAGLLGDWAGATSRGSRPRPQIRPGPRMEMFSRPSPQMRLLCQ